MKTSLLLVLGLLCLAVAKPHNEGKRNHQPKRTREHKLTNRMEHDHHRREHVQPHKTDAHHGKKAQARRPAAPANPAQGQHEIKKDLHLQHITEHNIEKKHDDKDGIPMESEHLIHVTPRPSKAHKVNKPLHHPASPVAAQPSPAAQLGAPANKGKAHKAPKKFSPKKHGWKKNMRKEKAKDKVKEKRERREKRNKALHRAIAARQL
ncbi:uncharacterized protein LOC123503322 isoform X3 [Portunus trituberculatus]|uniref:uncharacterized protein LOC123503322 isoform X3 n=1 Tax=Portunus trituberculatus TaxID=210409 RepID=UPI001E1CE139|nr:uncharacterized protein LOC123503322 isoform X3 [Portunus trituberculatus]